METISKKVGVYGKKFHSFEVKRPRDYAPFHMAYSLCGRYSPQPRRKMLTIVNQPPEDLNSVCKTCARVERIAAERERDEYVRGLLAYTAIADERTVFYGEPDPVEDFTDHELAAKYAEAENMPWPPPDIDTLYQDYPEHVNERARYFAEFGFAS